MNSLEIEKKFLLWPFFPFLAAALALGILPFTYTIGFDGVWYARMAENIFAGKGMAINPGEVYLDHPPFYSVLIGLLNLLAQNTELSGHLVSILAFSFTTIPLFFLARSIYSERAAN